MLFVLVISVPVASMENLARALREIAQSGSLDKDWNFNLSKVDVTAMTDISIQPLCKAFSDEGGTIKMIYQGMVDLYKNLGPLFPLSECHCSSFTRSFIQGPSVRTSCEQFVIRKLLDSANKKGGKVAYVSVGSGGLLTDFSIADQFLDKVPTAQLTVHAVDLAYKHYLLLLDFCKGQPYLTAQSVQQAKLLEWNLPEVLWREVELGWSLDNVQSTINLPKSPSNPIENGKIVEKLVVPNEQFQRFLYLLRSRHPKATVKLILWGSISQLTANLDILGHIPDFVGSVDGQRKASGSGASEGMNAGVNDFEKLWSTCISKGGACDNLVVGINDIMGGVPMMPEPQGASLWIQRLVANAAPFTKEFVMNCTSEMKEVWPYGLSKTFSCVLPLLSEEAARKAIDGL